MKIFKGIALTNSRDKTIKVAVERIYRHPLYGKQVKLTKKYLVHDEKGEVKQGEMVTLKEVRPQSKRKHFEVVK